MRNLSEKIPKVTKKLKAKGVSEAKKIGKFFGVPPPVFNLKIARHRKEFNRFINLPTSKPWLVGVFFKKELPEVILLHPKIVTREGMHKGPRDMERVLKHELTHLVFNQVYPLSQPLWLEEGIAVYLSGQHKEAKFDVKFFGQIKRFPLCLVTNDQWNNLRKFGAFGISGRFLEFLVKGFGKEKFNFLLRILPKDKYIQKIFLQHFKKIYRESLFSVGRKFLKKIIKTSRLSRAHPPLAEKRKEVRKNDSGNPN